jgi:hypothetical protein
MFLKKRKKERKKIEREEEINKNPEITGTSYVIHIPVLDTRL